MTRECDVCEEEIPKARLKAVPHTTMCVVCQEQNDVFRVRAVVTQNEEGDNEISGFVKDESSWEKLTAYKKDREER